MNGEKHKAQAFKATKQSNSRGKIIHIIQVLNKHSGMKVLSTFKLGLCF